jgi:hypothetical protein
MKVMRKVTLTALIVVLLTALFGCMSPVDQSGILGLPPKDMGQIRLSVVNPSARSILPFIPAIAEYSITFSGGPTTINDERLTAPSKTFNLAPGTYTLVVLAFENSGASIGDEFASATIPSIVVPLGGIVNQTVNLTFPDPYTGNSDNGTFVYNINNGTAGTGTLALAKVLTDSSANGGIDSFPGADITINDVATALGIISGVLQLNPGAYLVDIVISIDLYDYKRSEYLYIYQNMTSSLSVNITAADFPTDAPVGIIINPPVLQELIVTAGGTPVTTDALTLSATTTLSLNSNTPFGAVSNVQWIYNGTPVGTANTLIITPGSGSFDLTDSTNPSKPLSVLAKVGSLYLSRTITLTLN